MVFNPTVSDEELAQKLTEGSYEAFDEIMRRYKSRLFSFICKYGVDENEAYDLLQETFISMFQKSHLYDQERKYSTWIYQIALNKCRDWGRKRTLALFLGFHNLNNSDEYNYLIENIADKTPNPEELLIEKNELKTLAEAIKSLHDKLKTPLIMCVIEGMSHEECAIILGITKKTVETRIYRARKKLIEIIV